MTDFLLCSNCFKDHGLKLEALRFGVESNVACPNCNSVDGRKLDKDLVIWISTVFFVKGSVHRTEYGGAPRLVFNEHRYNEDNLSIPEPTKSDLNLIQDSIKMGFFYYGPRLWMIGEVEPLKDLIDCSRRAPVIDRILKEYPVRFLSEDDVIYRLRKNPSNPNNEDEFDSPPEKFLGNGRLDSKDLPIMYCSQDIESCVHECRVTVEDDIYIASLSPTRQLKLLDLTKIIDEDRTEFESLDIAIHMLFFAPEHSYSTTREIAKAVLSAGFDGLIYPSYFSQVRTGAMPFDTVYGISIRRFPHFREQAESQIIPNVAIFGRPVAEKILIVRSKNRVILNQVQYDIRFGPVLVDD